MFSPKSPYQQIDTPALLIDKALLQKNIADMQARATAFGVALRPHIKTHKSPFIAKMQVKAGACGITAAKVAEAEIMAAGGIKDILIANQIVGASKLERIADLGKKANISFGLDSVDALLQAEEVFPKKGEKACVLIEIDAGENRSGVTSKDCFLEILNEIKKCKSVEFKGIYSHESFTYNSPTVEACLAAFEKSQSLTLEYAQIAKEAGMPCKTVSVGATPTAWLCTSIKKGITEVRPGTYPLMDMGQANAIGTTDRCAATVLTTIISKPTKERLISDVGAKGLTAQSRASGICKTTGLGQIKGTTACVSAVYDEHAVIYDKTLNKALKIGEKVEIIPNHICPVVNLFEEAYLVNNGNIEKTIKISCRGKMR